MYHTGMVQQVTLSPIGLVHSSLKEPIDDVWGGTKCQIRLDDSRFTPQCLLGLAGFSHVEIVFLFHLVTESEVISGSRHPRNRLDWRW